MSTAVEVGKCEACRKRIVRVVRKRAWKHFLCEECEKIARRVRA